MARKGSNHQFEDSPFVFGSDSGRQSQGLGKKPPAPSTPAAIYKAQQESRFSLDKRLVVTIVLLVVAIALIPVTAILPTNLFNNGGFGSSLAQLGASVSGRIAALAQVGSETAAGMAAGVYLCQIVAVAIAGAALAMNGAVYQGALKNALASPSTLGVMSGATLGNVVYTIFILMPEQASQETLMRASEIDEYLGSLSPIDYFLTTQARVLCCLAGCGVVIALVLLIAYVSGKGRISKIGLIITGQVFTTLAAGAVDMIRFYVRDFGTDSQQQAIRSIMGGNFAYIVDLRDVALLLVPVAIGAVIVMALRNRLNLLAFDDDEARSLGINTNLVRNSVVVVCTVLTAVVVSFCGSIGFVGFLVPHLARKMVGPDFRYYIPTSICLGSVYLMVAYYLMNMSGVFQGSVGTFTSVIGIVFFAVLAIQQRARGNVDWL